MDKPVQTAEFPASAASPSLTETASDEESLSNKNAIISNENIVADENMAANKNMAANENLAAEVISRYFEALSAEDFPGTASLFAENGTLYPPFDSAVTGREAIVQYLEAEAKGLAVSPLKHTTELLEDGTTECRVTGKVQTSLFTVNAGWVFILNEANEILSVRVKLLAALEELLKLKPGTAES